MKKLLITTACILPFALGNPGYAQGSKGPSGSGAENPSKQSRTTNPDGQDKTKTESTVNQDTAADTERNAPAQRGSQESTTPIVPQESHTPRTTESDAGKNRSSTGDSAGPDQRRERGEGIR